MVEQVAQGQLASHALPDAGDHLHRQQRMAAQLEEVVMASDALDP